MTDPASPSPPTAATAANPAEAPPSAAQQARERRRAERANAIRQQILDTAEVAFGELGYHRAGLKTIAERCGLSVGSLYNFFEGKDDLYRAVFLRRGSEQHARMKDVAQSTESGLELLLSLTRSQVAYYREYPAYGRLATITNAPGARNAGLDMDLFREGYQVGMTLIRGAIERGQSDGSVRAGNPNALARMALAMMSTFHLMDPATAPFPEEYELEDFLALLRTTFTANL